MDRDPYLNQFGPNPRSAFTAEIDRLRRKNEVLDRQLGEARTDLAYARLNLRGEPRTHGGFVFFVTSILWIAVLIVSHGFRSDYEHHTAKNERGAVTADNSPKVAADYLKTIIPLPGGGVDSQCDAGKTWVGYRNGTGRALAIVDFEVRGYLPNRVANIVETKEAYVGKDKPNTILPNASLDRIVQPGDSFGECVKLDIADPYENHPELGKATYKAKPVSFKFLDDYPTYVQDQAKN